MNISLEVNANKKLLEAINEELYEKESNKSKEELSLQDATCPEDREFWMKTIDLTKTEMSYLLEERNNLNHRLDLLLELQKSYSFERGAVFNASMIKRSVSSMHSRDYRCKSYSVLGMGVAGQDYVLCVEKFPKPDEKIRSTDYSSNGGGNVANTLTTMSRLGVHTSLLSIVGTDPTGDLIINTLENDGVNTKWCVRSSSSSSAMTHIIVENETHTRTCIHTAMSQELTESHVHTVWTNYMELNARSIRECGVTDQIDMIHLDSRQTKAAVSLARLANGMGIPVCLDVEKFRPHIEALLPLCNIIFTNQHFPALYAQSSGVDLSGIEAMTAMLCHPSHRAQGIITTMGAQGSMMIRRVEDDLSNLRPHPGASTVQPTEKSLSPALLSLLESVSLPSSTTTETVKMTREDGTEEAVILSVTRCSAWRVSPEEVVDSTGAGDAFIGGFLAGFIRGYSKEISMRMGTIVAAEKLRGIGARSTLPTVEKLMSVLSLST